METALLVAQLGALSVVTAWLLLGVRDNVLYPDQNRILTSMVVRMELLKREHPDAFAQIGHRRIENPALLNTLFWIIVGAEILVSLVMLVGVGALAGAALGLLPAAGARAVAVLGAFGFTMIWASFLVAGNHFAYWFCHKEQQFTHYQMTMWGLGTLIFVVQG
ncbi:MAG: DUF2165 family protein [Pseudomonadota bacterium]